MSATLHCGDVRSVLATLPDESVQMCLTSPPYWGLRDYGTASWDGGDAGCDHLAPALGMSEKNTLGRIPGYREQLPPTNSANVGKLQQYRDQCGKCGARRVDNQLGLERTPEEYVANMVAVFREVRRVLRPDGILWLNLGDSYANPGATSRNVGRLVKGLREKQYGVGNARGNRLEAAEQSDLLPAKDFTGLKPKDLVGIPWLVAFALRADGWYLRSEVIWAKPNPMPESVTDRPTKAHEQVFLLSKSERYYYDAAAIAEEPAESTVRIHSSPNVQARAGDWQVDNLGNGHGGLQNGIVRPTRNARSVWTIATQPYAGAHFATFPEELARRCILAGSAARACEHCGAPWERVTEREKGEEQAHQRPKHLQSAKSTLSMSGGSDGWQRLGSKVTETGWQPSCACPSNTGAAQSTVLDPFGGSGTTAAVATGHGRRAIYIDLNPAYLDLAEHRIGPMLCARADQPEAA
jgi:DNA modification methylase